LIAATPEANAIPDRAPSRAAIFASTAARVGLFVRE